MVLCSELSLGLVQEVSKKYRGLFQGKFPNFFPYPMNKIQLFFPSVGNYRFLVFSKVFSNLTFFRLLTFQKSKTFF